MNITISPSVKKIVMRRIRVIWFVRRVLPLLIFETAAVTLIVRQLAESIFFNQVLQNAIAHTFSRSPFMIADFFIRAFLNTDTVVQLLVAGSLLVGAFILRDALRSLNAFAQKQSNFSQLLHVM